MVVKAPYPSVAADRPKSSIIFSLTDEAPTQTHFSQASRIWWPKLLPDITPNTKNYQKDMLMLLKKYIYINIYIWLDFHKYADPGV